MWRRAPRILNSEPGPVAHEPVELSRAILEEARELEGPGRCARLDALAGELHGLDPADIAGDGARLAFWINLYNGMVSLSSSSPRGPISPRSCAWTAIVAGLSCRG